MIPFVVVPAEDDFAFKQSVARYDGVKWCRFNDETIVWQSLGAIRPPTSAGDGAAELDDRAPLSQPIW